MAAGAGADLSQGCDSWAGKMRSAAVEAAVKRRARQAKGAGGGRDIAARAGKGAGDDGAFGIDKAIGRAVVEDIGQGAGGLRTDRPSGSDARARRGWHR